LLKLPVIDKNDILERLFETRGTGDVAWRRALSRESDRLFQTEALQAQGAILVSFWRLPGMKSDSGTPTSWLSESSRDVVHVACICSPEIAAARYFQRKRHPGQLDSVRSREEVLTSIKSISCLGALEIGKCIEVDTSAGHPELNAIAQQILSGVH
jgi:glucokinase